MKHSNKYVLKQSAILFGMAFSIVGCSQNAEKPPVNYVMNPEKIEVETSEIESNEIKSEEMTQDIEDETIVEYVQVENPSWDYYLAKEETAQQTPLKLIQESETANNITDTEEWFSSNQLENPYTTKERYEYRIENGCLLKVYNKESGDFVAGYDFSQFEYANDFLMEDKRYVQQSIQYAIVRDSILYVSIGHLTYAQTSPHNAYLMAINREDGKIIWKSEPLVSNARNFEVLGNVILCGYGFTGEDDYLYQLDGKTGKVIDKIRLKSMADYLIKKENKLYVRTYNTDYVFAIQE